MNNESFYHSTNRDRTNNTKIAQASDLYAFNYNQFLPANKDALIIDIGCSEGIALDWLLKQSYTNVYGIDPDEYAIEIAQKMHAGKLSKNRLLTYDSLEYIKNLEDNSIDMYVMLNVVEHLSKNDLLKLTKEIQRSLKPGGYFIAQTGNWENPFNIGLFSRDFTHQIMFTKNSLRQLLIMSGYSKENIKINSVSYKTTLKNWPFLFISPIVSFVIKLVALSMRCRINETAPLIYSIAKK